MAGEEDEQREAREEEKQCALVIFLVRAWRKSVARRGHIDQRMHAQPLTRNFGSHLYLYFIICP